jgi:hypothetical protein
VQTILKRQAMKKALHWYTLVLASFLTVAIFSNYSNKSPEVVSATTEVGDGLPQVIRPVDLDRPFDFAGEPVPMDNFDAKERLDRELTVNTYWHSSTVINLKNTYKYFPLIEKILAENEVPDDFKYLAVAESNLRNATSPAGAKGFWQFMKPTAEYYGLEVNSEVDERYHIEKATIAACEYIKGYKKRFGDWSLSAAAYNMGGTRLAKEMKQQRANNYYDLNLNLETSRYLFRLIAIKEIYSNPQEFGIYVGKEDGYAPLDDYRIVEVNTPIANWGDFAQEQGISYRMLKVYNPWLISSKLSNRARKTYEIKIPN